MNNWLIVEKLNLNDVVLFKDTIDNIIQSKNITSSILNKSTTGVSSKQYELVEYLKNLENITKVIQNKVKDALAKNNITNLPFDLKVINAWTIMGYEYCFHKIHRHGVLNNHISTVMYLNLSENTEDMPGNFYAILQDDKCMNFHYERSPQLGELIVFPVSVFHGTYPQGKGLRQTLNVEFEISYQI